MMPRVHPIKQIKPHEFSSNCIEDQPHFGGSPTFNNHAGTVVYKVVIAGE